MKIYKIHHKQELPITQKEAWNFFSTSENLATLTPPKMHLRFVEPDHSGMYAGKIIKFSVKPLPGFRATWVSEITQLEAPHYFVDKQLSGPYAVWHHEHRFIETDQGVLVEDIIHYAMPFGWLGRLLHRPVVKPQLKALFEFREQKLTELFKEN
jgi:ligand-binding SRPBCC domain-containing protein